MSDTKEYIQCDYIYVKFKDRETSFLVIEVRIVVISGDIVEKKHKAIF